MRRPGERRDLGVLPFTCRAVGVTATIFLLASCPTNAPHLAMTQFFPSPRRLLPAALSWPRTLLCAPATCGGRERGFRV